ncbi:MAG: PilZ domain-containing protein [Blastocatellia bacterium]|nr:PilZ domain-containing protein [Blastocatellia bacterium]
METTNSYYEARSEPRYRIVKKLYLRLAESEPLQKEEVITENISENGMCIWTRMQIPVQSRVYIETPEKDFRALATVIYNYQSHTGLKIITSKGKQFLFS